ncbi:hypothetical protein EQG49_05510 [Periweissella cryptocerci]|uniref:Uncharacterized protein n=1 Tax=Periweissella cryptocerci TaxID=2506420 RepID=A0A4P6YT89_9LACO|nr:hypothetical protein [Periweissella cryptocerci]QBO35954.1 hypothetical protein EQG49_05510 [Periweissella cryptocerci]
MFFTALFYVMGEFNMTFSASVASYRLSLNAIIEDFSIATGLVAEVLDAGGHPLSTYLPIQFLTDQLHHPCTTEENSHNNIEKNHIVTNDVIYKTEIRSKSCPIYNQSSLVGYIIVSTSDDDITTKLN